MKNIIDYFPINEDGKYINLENNKTYKNPRTILNYVYEKGMTGVEYAVKWWLVPENYVVYCKICNKPCVCISNHLKSNHKEYGGIKNYKKEYGENVPVISEIYKEHLSEKSKGENNVNHKSKTTLLERQQKSPFSIEFWKVKYPMKTDEQLNELLKVFRESALSDREFNTRLEYYINRGYSESESINLLKERQTTFSLDKCIEKHGDEKGLQIWKERQEKWLNSLLKNGNISIGYSRISQELFDNIKKLYKYDINNLKYATHNKELKIEYDNGYYLYDFADIKNKKIIEFHGDMYHGNPNKYNENDNPHPFRKDIKAKDMWEKDMKKTNIAKLNGFDVLVIWESEYRYKGTNNKDLVIKKCLDFIYS